MLFCGRRVLQKGQDRPPLPGRDVLKMPAGVELEGAGDALGFDDRFSCFRGGADPLHPRILGLLLPIPQGQVHPFRRAQKGVAR